MRIRPISGWESWQNPDVHADDRARCQAGGDHRYCEKAHRRGKVGWDVGREIEVAPHYRRPHLMLAWTGHRRAVPTIVPRNGTIGKRWQRCQCGIGQ